jgi:hypothetical protein
MTAFHRPWGHVVSRPFIVMESCFIDGHPRMMDYCWLRDTDRNTMHLKLNEQSVVSHVASSFLVATLPLRLQASTPISPFFLSFLFRLRFMLLPIVLRE